MFGFFFFQFRLRKPGPSASEAATSPVILPVDVAAPGSVSGGEDCGAASRSVGEEGVRESGPSSGSSLQSGEIPVSDQSRSSTTGPESDGLSGVNPGQNQWRIGVCVFESLFFHLLGF